MKRISSFRLTDRILKKKKSGRRDHYLILYPPTLLFSNYQRPQHVMNYLSKRDDISCVFCDWTVKDLKVNPRFYVSRHAFNKRYLKSRFKNFHDMKKVYYFSVPEKIKLLKSDFSDIQFDKVFFELMDMPINQFAAWQDDLDEAIRCADIISTTNVFITAYLEERTSRPVITSRNGVDVDMFSKENMSPAVPAVPENGAETVRAGFYGNLENWIDWDLIDTISRIPGVHVYIVGKTETNEKNIPVRIRSSKSISVIDYQPVEKLVHFLKIFDICLYPFKICEMTDAVDPLKLWEYLCFGKPVIASETRYISYLTASDKILADTIYKADKHRADSNLIHRILRNEADNPSLAQERINYVYRNRRWEVICDAIYRRIVA